MIDYIYYLNELLDPYRVYRIGPFSAVDTIGAYLGALLVAPLVKRLAKKMGLAVTIPEILALILPTALIFHVLFGMDTAFTRMFFESGNYVAKGVIFLMALFGLKSIARLT